MSRLAKRQESRHQCIHGGLSAAGWRCRGGLPLVKYHLLCGAGSEVDEFNVVKVNRTFRELSG
jgi:hypothetical protein